VHLPGLCGFLDSWADEDAYVESVEVARFEDDVLPSAWLEDPAGDLDP
jgi:hypothetical protein